MTGEALGFWAVAVVLLAASLGVVLTRNLFHAVLYLAAALVATAVEFLLLDSPFLFAVQLLLYAGGVVTIVVFAIMLTERLVGADPDPDQSLHRQRRHRVGRRVRGHRRLPAPGAAGGRRPRRPPRRHHRGRWVRRCSAPSPCSFVLLAVLLVAALIGALYFARADD